MSRLMIPAGFFVAIFGAYLYALSPSIYAGDAGLFAAASFSLGSAHPPGYPLYILLGKLLTFLPFGNIAYKVNLVSALFGALACLLLYHAAHRLTGDQIASMVAAALCGITPLFFSQAVQAEVYTLNAFLSTAVFSLGLLILDEEREERIRGYGLIGFLVLGLGMGNHHTIALTGLGFLYPLLVRRKALSIGFVLLCAIFFTAGFSVNLLLYLRSLAIVKNGGLILYSIVLDRESFLNVFFRKLFGETDTLGALGSLRSSQGLLYGIRNVFMNIFVANGGIFLPFVILGLWALLRRAPQGRRTHHFVYITLLLFIWTVVLGHMTISMALPTRESVQVVSVYYLPALPIYYATVSIGLALLLERVGKSSLRFLRKALPAALFLLPLMLLPYSLATEGLNGNFLAYDYGRDMLTALAPKSLLINMNDNAIFTTFYLKAVERYRDDVLTMESKRGSKTDRFGLYCSPPWKYSTMYPDFFKKENSTLSELNRDFVKRGAFYTSYSQGLTPILAQEYDTYPYLLSYTISPVETASEIRQRTINDFEKNYNKLNYERVMALPFLDDHLTNELYAAYAFDTMIHGGLLSENGKVAAGAIQYGRALAMAPVELFLYPYAQYLVDDGREQEARVLLENLKETEIGEYAVLVEERLRSNQEEQERRRENEDP